MTIVGKRSSVLELLNLAQREALRSLLFLKLESCVAGETAAKAGFSTEELGFRDKRFVEESAKTTMKL